MKAALCKMLDGPQAIVIEDIATPEPGRAKCAFASARQRSTSWTR